MNPYDSANIDGTEDNVSVPPIQPHWAFKLLRFVSIAGLVLLVCVGMLFILSLILMPIVMDGEWR